MKHWGRIGRQAPADRIKIIYQVNTTKKFRFESAFNTARNIVRCAARPRSFARSDWKVFFSEGCEVIKPQIEGSLTIPKRSYLKSITMEMLKVAQALELDRAVHHIT